MARVRKFFYYIKMYLVIKPYLKMEWEQDWTTGKQNPTLLPSVSATTQVSASVPTHGHLTS